jgi:hypothetical protein
VEANLKKLELLYDHTKFHIGFCLILTSAYITLVTSKIGRKDALPVLQPALAWLAVALFMVAGIAAGVVASSATQSKCNGADDFLREKIGPWNTALLPARLWVHIEHSAFWLAVICAVLSFVFSK